MRLLLLTLCLLCCIVHAQRKAVAVLYESTSDTSDTLTDVKMVGVVKFSQESASSNLIITINLYTNDAFSDGKHGFHIHGYGENLTL